MTARSLSPVWGEPEKCVTLRAKNYIVSISILLARVGCVWIVDHGLKPVATKCFVPTGLLFSVFPHQQIQFEPRQSLWRGTWHIPLGTRFGRCPFEGTH